MPFTDAFGQRKKNDAMKDTWGHMYPEPCSKHYGEMIIAHTETGDLVIIKSDFPGLDGSPMRYWVEHTVFDIFETEGGKIYKVSCGLWFFKGCHDMYKGEPIGKIIYPQIEEVSLGR
jgi:hypothetical protein